MPCETSSKVFGDREERIGTRELLYCLRWAFTVFEIFTKFDCKVFNVFISIPQLRYSRAPHLSGKMKEKNSQPAAQLRLLIFHAARWRLEKRVIVIHTEICFPHIRVDRVSFSTFSLSASEATSRENFAVQLRNLVSRAFFSSLLWSTADSLPIVHRKYLIYRLDLGPLFKLSAERTIKGKKRKGEKWNLSARTNNFSIENGTKQPFSFFLSLSFPGGKFDLNS